MHDNNDPRVSGQLLVADFQTVLVSTATSLAAKQAADMSEAVLVDQLNSMSSGSFLDPGNLPAEAQTDITRESLDAHIKKFQALQLDALSAQQLESLIAQDNTLYAGRKVHVSVIDPSLEPVEFVWFNSQTGYRTSTVKKTSLTGTIQEVLLDQNTLILQPSLTARLFGGDLHSYLVHVIHPQTLLPVVELTLV
jgi:hypothetical protein